MRRSIRVDNGRGRSIYMHDTIREREPYRLRKLRRWYPADDDDD